MSFHRLSIGVGQTTPGHKPHYTFLVEQQYGRAFTVESFAGRIQRCLVDIIGSGGVLESIGESVERLLLASAFIVVNGTNIGYFLPAAASWVPWRAT